MQERGARAPLSAPSPARARSPRRVGLLLAVAAAVIAVDQLTKWWAVRTLDDHDIHVVWTLRLHLTRNTGAAFSSLTGRGAIIGLVAIAVVGVLAWMGRGVATAAGAVALALVLGGAIGNLADRVAGGAVTDFIDFYVGTYHWHTFNVADSAITVGVILLLLDSLRRERPA